MFGFISLLPLLLIGITGCDSTSLIDEVVDDAVEEAAGEHLVPKALAEELTDRVNEARGRAQNCGNERFPEAPPLAWSHTLAKAAVRHSQDMAKNSHFSHTGTDGSNAGARIKKAGYNAGTWGENIAAGYGTAEQVVTGWLNSPGHCANIMNSNFTEFATASAENDGSAYGIYWTMVLAAPR